MSEEFEEYEKVISDVIDIRYLTQDSSRLIERGLEWAMREANWRFDIDEDCHSSKVKEWCRSDSSIKVEFVGVSASGGYTGWEYVVHFKARCEKYISEPED